MTSFDDIAVLTSENVRLTYTLSGMGRRALAFIVDTIIISLLMLVITALFFLGLLQELADVNLDAGSRAVQKLSMLAGLYIGVMTFILWGYYFIFEWINWGQTPGKMLMGIRVSMADGAPVDIVACAVRNVIRIVDLLFLYIGITIFILIFTPKYQRLGDLAAGTVVVIRRRLSFDNVLNAARETDRAQEFIQAERPETNQKIRISDQEHDLLLKFIERRESLPENVRTKLANDLASRLRSRSPGGAMDDLPDEDVIVAAIADFEKKNV